MWSGFFYLRIASFVSLNGRKRQQEVKEKSLINQDNSEKTVIQQRSYGATHSLQ